MFCPRCSDAQISEHVRFCKRCGLRLEAVQDLISADTRMQSQADAALPPQREISIGAGLMFIGSVVAMVFSRSRLGGDPDVLPQVFLILSFTLGFILLLFHPLLGGLKNLFSGTEQQGDAREQRKHRAKQRDGINLGALLMFLGTVKAMLLATLVPDLAQRPMLTIEIAAGMFLLLLVIRRLVGGVYRLFFENSEAQQAQAERVTSDLQPALRGGAPGLHPAQPDKFIPLQRSTSECVEIMQPASVTENTTGLLGK